MKLMHEQCHRCRQFENGLKPKRLCAKCKQKYIDGVSQQSKDAHARKKRPLRKVCKQGYAYVRHESEGQQGNYAPEHRVVMAEKLGRPLRKGESVHHINGIRDDNRPENLELWIGPIRNGQRAKDIRCPHCNKTYLQQELFPHP